MVTILYLIRYVKYELSITMDGRTSCTEDQYIAMSIQSGVHKEHMYSGIISYRVSKNPKPRFITTDDGILVLLPKINSRVIISSTLHFCDAGFYEEGKFQITWSQESPGCGKWWPGDVLLEMRAGLSPTYSLTNGR